MSHSTGPVIDQTGLYYVTWWSSEHIFYERWFHTYTAAVRWLKEIRAKHP